MGFTALGGTSLQIIPRQEDGSIDLGFVAASNADIYAGTAVKMSVGGVDGLVAPCTAVTDEPIGIACVGENSLYKDIVDDSTLNRVTVKTPFVAVIKAECDGDIDYGDKTAQSGMSTDNTVQPKHAAVTEGIYYGVALESGSDGDTITIGILRQPILISSSAISRLAALESA